MLVFMSRDVGLARVHATVTCKPVKEGIEVFSVVEAKNSLVRSSCEAARRGLHLHRNRQSVNQGSKRDKHKTIHIISVLNNMHLNLNVIISNNSMNVC